MQYSPLVTIICLCHNHAPWVRESLDAAWQQAYPHIQLIVVDDASTDNSKQVIEQWLADKPQVQYLPFQENQGNCRAFNRAFALARGEYIIDLAADDVLLPERVAVGVEAMTLAGPEWGVHFSDAFYINEKGRLLKSHYKRDMEGRLLQEIPQGWVYSQVLERYFICTPSMMMRRHVLESLGGYDESLAYEDFDFWVRSARQWKYRYTDQVLVKKRILPRSWSARQYEIASAQLASTLKICYKAKALNQSPEEDKSLGRRLGYELRQAIRHRQWEVAAELLSLKKQVWPVRWEDHLYAFFIKKHHSQS